MDERWLVRVWSPVRKRFMYARFRGGARVAFISEWSLATKFNSKRAARQRAKELLVIDDDGAELRAEAWRDD